MTLWASRSDEILHQRTLCEQSSRERMIICRIASSTQNFLFYCLMVFQEEVFAHHDSRLRNPATIRGG